MMADTHSTRRIFPRLVLILIALAGFTAQARADLQFDGKRDVVTLDNKQRLAAADIGEITLRISRKPGTEDGAILLALRGRIYFTVGYTIDNKKIEFMSSTNETVDMGKDVDQRADHILRLLHVDDGWTVQLDTITIGTLNGSAFLTAPADRFALEVGGAGFAGTIGVNVLSRDGLAFAHETSNGTLVARTLPRPGAYVGQDTGRSTPEPETLPGIDSGHHGVYKKQTFYALSKNADGVALVVDWGGALDLVPDLDHPTRYIPKYPAFDWAGAIEFADEPDSNAIPQFTAVMGHATGARPFLANDAIYVLVPEREMGEGEQEIGSVWAGTNFPPGFNFSVEGCYNVPTMNLEDFQRTGCGGGRIFALPPAKSGAYTTPAQNILPFGWRWKQDIVHENYVFSTLITSSKDATSAISGSSSSGFNLLGYAQAHNETTENKSRTETASEKMKSVQQFFERQHSLVLDPSAVYLDSCFVRKVLRAAAGIKAQKLKIAANQLTADQLPTAPPYFDPSRSNADCPARMNSPFPVAQLLADYGTHYTNAITYGARGIRWAVYDKTETLKMVAKDHNLNQSEGFQFELNVGNKSVSYPVKGGVESSTVNGTSNADTTTAGFKAETSYTICYGGISCKEGAVDGGNKLIPIYLDLVRFDQLLAPPYFTDLTVIQDLRALVAAELDKKLLTVRPTPPPSFHVIDAQVVDSNCDYNAHVRDQTPGSFRPPWIWLTGLCEKTDTMALAAFATDGGTVTPVALRLVNPSDPDSKLVWPDAPRLGSMSECIGGQGASCTRRTFRMMFESNLDKTGDLVKGQKIGFKVTNAADDTTKQPPLRDYILVRSDVDDLLDACKFAHTTGGSVLGALSNPNDPQWRCSSAKRNLNDWRNPFVLLTQYLSWPQSQAAPPTISGQFARTESALGNGPLFSRSLTLKLTEQNFGTRLGYKESPAVSPAPANLSLTSLQPTDTFPWIFGDPLNSQGMFRRCEAIWGSGNCEQRLAIVYAKPAARRKPQFGG